MTLPTLHEIAWTLRVSEVKEEAAQRCLDWYNKQPPGQRHKTAWANTLNSARAILELLERKSSE